MAKRPAPPPTRGILDGPITASTTRSTDMIEATTAQAQHKMAMDALGLAAQLLTPHADTFGALIEAERNMHSSMHITDPTLYIRALNDKGLHQQVRLFKAALEFVLEVQRVKGELLEADA